MKVQDVAATTPVVFPGVDADELDLLDDLLPGQGVLLLDDSLQEVRYLREAGRVYPEGADERTARVEPAVAVPSGQ